MADVKTILSVDDSATIRKVIADTMRQEGVDTIQAESCAQAFKVLQERAESIELMILDVNMPGMSGLDFLEKLKSHPGWARIPVMMLTTESERATIVRAVQAGAANYLVKPFSRNDLLAKIKQALQLT
ncbi:MAG: response regulator [Kiritimatiellae bacterium]|nr:response regulator [Kiritimatiellia bacterium]